ncbi:MAG: peptide chain release factor 1 [Candidatus Peregrinibacteria bacterium]
MLDKLNTIIAEYDAIQAQFLDPEISSDLEQLKELGKKKTKIEETALMGKEYIALLDAQKEAKEMLEDAEMRDMAKEELEELEPKIVILGAQLTEDLTPKDPNDPKNILLEIRAGAGGEEASLFASELVRMYFRYAENMGFSTEIISVHESENGGYKELVAEISGKNAYKHFKFESGVHRVQRIPKTESQGRIHTSTASVAIIPEIEDMEEVEIKREDVRIDTYRASGAGGQHINKTDSAVRLTHIPTGLVVACQDERSQHKNKERAFRVLASRIVEAEQEKRITEGSEKRLSQIGTGDRSEKIRTYNFPQDRVTDHRIKMNFSNIPALLSGEIGDMLSACAIAAEKG